MKKRVGNVEYGFPSICLGNGSRGARVSVRFQFLLIYCEHEPRRAALAFEADSLDEQRGGETLLQHFDTASSADPRLRVYFAFRDLSGRNRSFVLRRLSFWRNASVNPFRTEAIESDGNIPRGVNVTRLKY